MKVLNDSSATETDDESVNNNINKNNISNNINNNNNNNNDNNIYNNNNSNNLSLFDSRSYSLGSFYAEVNAVGVNDEKWKNYHNSQHNNLLKNINDDNHPTNNNSNNKNNNNINNKNINSNNNTIEAKTDSGGVKSRRSVSRSGKKSRIGRHEKKVCVGKEGKKRMEKRKEGRGVREGGRGEKGRTVWRLV